MFFGVDGGWWCISFMYGCGGSDGGFYGAICKPEVEIGWLPQMAHSDPLPRMCKIISLRVHQP